MTFHAAARRQLSYFWPRVVGDTGWQLLDTKFAVVAQAANRAGMSTSTDDVRDLAGEIEWAKASLISPESYAAAVAKAGRDIPFDAAKIATVYAGYETLKARRDGMALLDFDDLLLHTAAAIENDDAVAQEFRDRYRCFVVDEYQDVTPLQQRVLDAWLGARDDLTVVGDANQTIYSFTGATPRYLLDFSRRFPDAAVVRLERDYRSTPQVVSLANRVIAAARGRMAGSKLHLVGQRDPGPTPSFSEHTDEVAEAAAVAKKIKNLIESGTPPSEIAVLYRINAQSEVYEEALTEAGVPFQVRGGEGFFSRQEIRQALLALQRACERDASTRVRKTAEIVRAVLEPLGLTAEPPAGTRARERWEALAALAELVDEEVAQRPSLDLRALLAELRQRADARHPPVVQGVTLASLHAAKGLEWDAVFLVGLADGTLPISHALAHGPDSEPVEEERRLFYVGITRARVHLALSWALARAPGGRQSRRPSRFLNGIAPQSPSDATPNRPRRPKGRHTPLPRLQRHADHTARDHAAPLRKLPVRHRRGAARAAEGLAAAHLQGNERARLCGVHRQHVDRDRRDAAHRRRGAGRDPRYRRAQARAVRPRCAGDGQGPPIVRKNRAKSAGQKIGCRSQADSLNLKITQLCDFFLRKEGARSWRTSMRSPA